MPVRRSRMTKNQLTPWISVPIGPYTKQSYQYVRAAILLLVIQHMFVLGGSALTATISTVRRRVDLVYLLLPSWSKWLNVR